MEMRGVQLLRHEGEGVGLGGQIDSQIDKKVFCTCMFVLEKKSSYSFVMMTTRQTQQSTPIPTNRNRLLRVDDSDLNLNSRLDGDGGDLLDDVCGSVEVNEPLVDAHLELVPGVGSLS